MSVAGNLKTELTVYIQVPVTSTVQLNTQFSQPHSKWQQENIYHIETRQIGFRWVASPSEKRLGMYVRPMWNREGYLKAQNKTQFIL